MKHTTATWDLSLDITCPHCEEDFDLVGTDQWPEIDCAPLECMTPRTQAIEVACPHCGEVFTVKTEPM